MTTTTHLALVAETEEVGPSELARVSAALQRQITRDLAPMWNVIATVDAFPTLEDVPAGYWPVLVTSSGTKVRAELHLDRDGQPFAHVPVSPLWSIEASRVCLELLVNPFGNRMVSGLSPRSDQGPVELVVEVCAACGDAARGYVINDVVVSDFCAPSYFEQAPSSATRYSVNGSIAAPLAVLPGGHITWYDLVTDTWWSRNHWGENPVDVEIEAPRKGGRSPREATRRPQRLSSALVALDALEARIARQRIASQRAASLRAVRLRAAVGGPIALGPGESEDATLELLRTEAIPQAQMRPSRAPSPLPPPLPSQRPRTLEEGAPIVSTPISAAPSAPLPAQQSSMPRYLMAVAAVFAVPVVALVVFGSPRDPQPVAAPVVVQPATKPVEPVAAQVQVAPVVAVQPSVAQSDAVAAKPVESAHRSSRRARRAEAQAAVAPTTPVVALTRAVDNADKPVSAPAPSVAEAAPKGGSTQPAQARASLDSIEDLLDSRR